MFPQNSVNKSRTEKSEKKIDLLDLVKEIPQLLSTNLALK